MFTNLIKNVGKKRKKIYFVLSENEIQTYKYTEILKFLHENDLVCELVLPKNEKCYVHKYDVIRLAFDYYKYTGRIFRVYFNYRNEANVFTIVYHNPNVLKYKEPLTCFEMLFGVSSYLLNDIPEEIRNISNEMKMQLKEKLDSHGKTLNAIVVDDDVFNL